MKRVIVPFVMVFVFLLAACQGDTAEPAATVAPTQPPAVVESEPTGETAVSPTSSSIPAAPEHVPDPDLIDKTWAWEARDPNGSDTATLDVPNPENYTLTFNEDGTFSAQVDCNNAAGSYATTPPDAIAMQPGPTTLAACPPGSLADEMMKLFGEAQNFRFLENGNVLILAWANGGPLDFFRLLDAPAVDLPAPPPDAQTAVGKVIAPDGVFLRTGPGVNYPYVGAAPFGETGEVIGISEDGQWWLAAAPQLPEGEVWVAAQFVDVQNGDKVPVVAAHALELDLIGIPWEWVSTTDPVQGPVYVNDPSRYVILFKDDNTATILADCNHVQAAYTLSDSSLTITPGVSTRAACPPDSQANAFLQQLTNVAIFHIQGGNLYLDQMADRGTMRFVAQGAPVPDQESPVEEADAHTFYLVSFGPADAPQPVIPGTTITGNLADDLASGFAGCNNFSGTITPANGYFTIDNIVTGQKTCAEPAGVMEQEQAFLAGLTAVNGNQWRSEIINGIEVITQGQLFYKLPDGGAGVMNFVTTR